MVYFFAGGFKIEDYMDSYNQERCSSKLKSRVLSHIEPGLYRAIE